jgi:amino-acid N-acetyltransferase
VTEGAEPVIATAATADREAVEALLHACALPTEDLPASLEHFFVARAAGRVVGVIGVQELGRRGLLRSLAVSPDWRGKGLGHRLWRVASACARRLGLEDLFLLTTTAEAIFANWGFARILREEAPPELRQTPEYRTLCPSSAAVMRLSL